MQRINLFIKLLSVILGIFSCISCEFSDFDDSNVSVTSVKDTQLQIDFVDGEYHSYTKAYAIWIENDSGEFIQNLFVCNRINLQNLAGTGLPYWEMNKRPISDNTEVDAVSGATQKRTDFSVSELLKANEPRFTIFFEVDHSFDSNDWFSDQPAILYSAEIDLSNSSSVYPLEFVGWTANENTANTIPNSPEGVLHSEKRYITHHRLSSGDFGENDDRTATDMVGSITLTIVR